MLDSHRFSEFIRIQNLMFMRDEMKLIKKHILSFRYELVEENCELVAVRKFPTFHCFSLSSHIFSE